MCVLCKIFDFKERDVQISTKLIHEFTLDQSFCPEQVARKEAALEQERADNEEMADDLMKVPRQPITQDIRNLLIQKPPHVETAALGQLPLPKSQSTQTRKTCRPFLLQSVMCKTAALGQLPLPKRQSTQTKKACRPCLFTIFDVQDGGAGRMMRWPTTS